MCRFEFDKTFLKSGIYIIKCIQTKKYYVGSAGSVYNRLQNHKRFLKNPGIITKDYKPIITPGMISRFP